MSAHAVLGLLGLNAVFLVAGCAILWGIGGWTAWSVLLRRLGVAYLVGFAAVVLCSAEILALGSQLSVWTVLVTAAALAAGSVGLGVLLGRKAPPRPRPGRPRLVSWQPAWVVGAGALVAALAVVFMEAFFGVSLFQGVYHWDAWGFWVPHAETIYYSGRLDPTLWGTLDAPSYPILVPTLTATAFHFMGTPDTTLVGFQFWAVTVGFVFAVAGLLRPRVPLIVLWPFLGLLLVMPYLDQRAGSPEADLTLDYLLAAGAVAAALWLLDRREGWLLVVLGILLAAAFATKREGLLFAAFVLLAALAASIGELRYRAPRLAAVALCAYLTTLPWHFWWTSHDFRSETGLGWSAGLGRAWSSLDLVLGLVFSDDRWLIAVPLALAAAMLLLVRRDWRLGSFYVVAFVLALLEFTWILWSNSYLPIESTDKTPLPRAVGALVVFSAALAPLMLARVLDPVPAPERRLAGRTARLPAVAAVVLAVAAVYAAAGVAPAASRSAPPPTCTAFAPVPAGIRAILGMSREASALVPTLLRAHAVGFGSAELVQEGCGAYEVAVPGIPDEATAKGFEAEATHAGFHVLIAHGS